MRVEEKGIASETPLSVPGLLNRIVARYPENVAIASKNINGDWVKVTYRYAAYKYVYTYNLKFIIYVLKFILENINKKYIHVQKRSSNSVYKDIIVSAL